LEEQDADSIIIYDQFFTILIESRKYFLTGNANKSKEYPEFRICLFRNYGNQLGKKRTTGKSELDFN
jgi:hypothetical protein